jgi:raffinose/stachyose/melibiose transport system permease protein
MKVKTNSAARGQMLGRGDRLPALLFLFPGLFFYICFLVLPLVGTLILSFTDWNGFSFLQIRFAGLENFRHMVDDPVFLWSFVHNLVFFLGNMTLKIGLALLLALILDQGIPGANLLRGVYLLPTVLSLVVVGVTFKLALSPTLGFINPFLKAIGLHSLAGDFLGSPSRALIVLVLIDSWGGFGLFMFLFVSRLIGISQELHEAAYIDGANRLQDIWYITFPHLAATYAMVALLGAIESFKLFANVYVLTTGGPNHASEVLSTWAYFEAFTANKVGYGSSILLIQLLITVLIVFFQTKYQPRVDT